MTQAVIEKHFKGATWGCDVENIIYEKLTKLGFNDENTLFSDSSCPDEINHLGGDEVVPTLFQKRWGHVFPLSGLGGLPFTGKTGWGAFSSHCPEDGNIVVLFAPHVGIDA